MDPVVAQVVVPRPLPGPLSYAVPARLAETVRVGSAVQVPFRSQSVVGFVVALDGLTPEGVALKEIESTLFDTTVFSKLDLAFFDWISDYYQLPVGEVFHSAFPKSVLAVPKRARKAAETDADAEAGRTTADVPVLTPDQTVALDEIARAFESRNFASFLLFGVTGSGKTEVYIRAAEAALRRGREALILVPEIALTPQLRRRFEDRFGGEVAVLHSSLTEKARREYWWDIRRGRRRVAVGARSALFAPLGNIGLIVVDEEHEPSYKQEDRLRYNARDLALVRAKQHGAVAILGSATPSVETFHAAESGKHRLLRLTSRPSGGALATVEVVDLKEEGKDRPAARPAGGSRPLLGPRLREALVATLERGEQAMVFVNRKGFASFLLCDACGEVPKCLNCSVSLTYYDRARELRCHYCAFSLAGGESCAACGAPELRRMGMGTETVEDELQRLLQGTPIERLDADAANTPRKLHDTLERFRLGETRVLVGTQMLAKGHDFPNVTLVGVVLADLNLHLPDFRAGERTFQLLTQVSGRAGRGDKPGRVILQTYLPNNYVIASAANQDYLSFYKTELGYRREFGYPPFSRMAQVEFRHLKEDGARLQAERIRQLLEHLTPGSGGLLYLGPAAASIARIANQYRWQILLKSEKSSALNAVVKTLRKEGVRFIDVDPVTTL